MADCFGAFYEAFPDAVLECRTDSAFFNEKLVLLQDEWGTEFTMSVPFERFANLREIIQSETQWKRANGDTEYFEIDWKPECWERHEVRLIAVRRRQRKQRKAPLQLDLFVPLDFEYNYSVIATNKVCSAKRVIAFHHGRGSQEKTIGELKSAMQFDYIPCRKQLANETYMLAAVYAHNLLRLLQMQDAPQRTNKQWTRPACWIFQKAESFRRKILLRAGRLTYPKNRQTLTVSGDEEIKGQSEAFLAKFQDAA